MLDCYQPHSSSYNVVVLTTVGLLWEWRYKERLFANLLPFLRFPTQVWQDLYLWTYCCRDAGLSHTTELYMSIGGTLKYVNGYQKERSSSNLYRMWNYDGISVILFWRCITHEIWCCLKLKFIFGHFPQKGAVFKMQRKHFIQLFRRFISVV